MNGLPSILELERNVKALEAAPRTPELEKAITTCRGLLRWVKHAGTPPVEEPTEKQRAASLPVLTRSTAMHLVRAADSSREHVGIDLRDWVPARRFADLLGMRRVEDLHKAAHYGKAPKADLMHRQRAYWKTATVRDELTRRGLKWTDEPSTDRN